MMGTMNRSGKGATSYEMTETDLAHFWRLMKPFNLCWLWRGKVGDGEVPVPLFQLESGKYVSARRVAWQIMQGGPIPTIVLTTCGNPLCMLGSHLVAERGVTVEIENVEGL
jgi:hypothetical protein